MSITPSVAVDTVKKPTMPFSNAKILYVGGTGEGNYTKIQDAIDDANWGDTILVFSGTYKEWIRINKQLFIKGIKKPGENIPIINGGDDHDTVIINADGCSFEGFKVRNGDSGYLQVGITLKSNNNFISNCTSFNTGTGLFLTSSSNNIICFNEMYDGWEGIRLRYESCNNQIFDNNIHSHSNDELWLQDSSNNNLIFNNSFSHSIVENGVYIQGNSSHNVFQGNVISSNHRRGIRIGSGYNLTIVNNTFIDNGITVGGNWDSHTIENNTANGRPIYFYRNKNGIVVPNDAAQVILYNCFNFTIQNLNLLKVDNGVTLVFSSHNTISNNTISACCIGDGIHLSSSSDNIISGNTILSGCYYGIYVSSSAYNIIFENTIKGGNLRGIHLGSSGNTTISNNTILGYHLTGICVDSSSNNKITGNYISKSMNGMAIGGSHNIVTENHVYDCSKCGIGGSGSICNTFYNNEVAFGAGNGMNFKGASYCNITKNTISSNNGIGIDFRADFSIVSENIIKNNGEGGIYSQASYSSIITRNIIQSNGYAIYLYISNKNVISRNNFLDNLPHIFFTDSYRNKWIRNYWDEFRFFPKIIVGRFTIPSFNPYEPPSYFKWINIDWFPAKEPYDI